jgi:intergrase/recombinase
LLKVKEIYGVVQNVKMNIGNVVYVKNWNLMIMLKATIVQNVADFIVALVYRMIMENF